MALMAAMCVCRGQRQYLYFVPVKQVTWVYLERVDGGNACGVFEKPLVVHFFCVEPLMRQRRVAVSLYVARAGLRNGGGR